VEDSVREVCPEVCTMPKNRQFDTSCFSGKYVTGDIDAAYFKKLEKGRSDAALAQKNKKYVTVVGAAGDGTDLDVGDGALMNTPV
jgi:amidophosphoribosyltransferase